jgi:hypothetical protein
VPPRRFAPSQMRTARRDESNFRKVDKSERALGQGVVGKPTFSRKSWGPPVGAAGDRLPGRRVTESFASDGHKRGLSCCCPLVGVSLWSE